MRRVRPRRLQARPGLRWAAAGPHTGPVRRPLCPVPLSLLSSIYTQTSTLAPSVVTSSSADAEGQGGCSPSRVLCDSIKAVPEGTLMKLDGWLVHNRHLGSIAFGVLRDASGRVQIVWEESQAERENLKSSFMEFRSAPIESVIRIIGHWKRRPEKEIVHNELNGDIEVIVTRFEVLNKCMLSLPFPTEPKDEEKLTSELVRMEYRYLDLRRPRLQNNIRTRSNITQAIRTYLHGEKFVEIDTPTLFKSTPEGAREFLVPTRSLGKFYALPQSPQQYKQLLMTAGFEKYFQIARCYRDELGRADRQPEFTQVDIEMSFVEENDVMSLIERLLYSSMEGFTPLQNAFSDPLRRMTYTEAMSCFGTDKPDLRYNMEIQDFTKIVQDAIGKDANVAWTAVAQGINSKGLGAKLSRKDLQKLKTSVQHPLAEKVYLIKVEDGEVWKLPKSIQDLYFNATCRAAFEKKLQVEAGDLLVLATSTSPFTWENTASVLGQYRCKLAEISLQYGLLPESDFDVENAQALWVTDFPLFESGRTSGTLRSTHHPFTAPSQENLFDLLNLLKCLQDIKNSNDETPPYDEISQICDEILLLKPTARSYDLVVNGVELGGGSIRISDAELQRMVFSALDANHDSFAHLLTALSCGTPPHGGFALGLDRLVSLICEEENIREVIAFPKNAYGNDPMTGAPSMVSTTSISEYHLQIKYRTDGT